MKSKTILALIFLIGYLNCLVAQKYYEEEFTETIKKSISFDRVSDTNAFFIDNVSGTIDVVGYSGKTIEVEIVKIIKAHDKEGLETGRREIKIGEYQDDDNIYLYLDAPFIEFDVKELKCNPKIRKRTGRNLSYQYTLDYKVKIPNRINLRLNNASGKMVTVSRIRANCVEARNLSGHLTLNDIKALNIQANVKSGHIRATDIHAEDISAKTASGRVELTDISGKTIAETISGNINISYSRNPNKNSSFETTSGNIDVRFRENLDAEIDYHIEDSGKLFSDYPIGHLNAPKSSNHPNRPLNYSKNREGRFEIGSGHPRYIFRTGSGNIYIRKIK